MNNNDQTLLLLQKSITELANKRKNERDPELIDLLNEMLDIAQENGSEAMELFAQTILAISCYQCIKTNKSYAAMFRSFLREREYSGNPVLTDVAYNLSGKKSQQAKAEATQKTSLQSESQEVVAVAEDTPPKRACGRSAYSELNSLVGCEQAKTIIREAVDFAKLQRLYTEVGLPKENAVGNMVFCGAPGTAKTTVARLFAEIMQEEGILKRGQLLECGRADLVATYVGQTAPKVRQMFNRAKGGVLFIDEAYSLIDMHENSFGDEAISTIVQEMENRRNDTVVILAGYPDKMEKLLQLNPGLRSRIAYHVDFQNYLPSELCEIIKLCAKNKGFTLQQDVFKKLLPHLAAAAQQPDFGNGRYVRTLFEQARKHSASRLLRLPKKSLTKKVLTTLIAEDFVFQENWQAKRRFGFST